MTHECIGIKPEVDDLNKAIDNIEKLVDTKHLRYYHSRLQERHDILMTNASIKIENLEERIKELESHETKEDINTEKINIHLIYDKASNTVKFRWTLNSKKRDTIFDEVGRKWFIPKLNDDSYIKIKFIGKNLDEQEKLDENKLTLVRGLSGSSAIIGNTIIGRGNLKDIKNNFIINKRTLRLLLIDSSMWFVNRIYVWFYVLHGTEDIEIIESSEDINATLEVI